MKRRTLQFPPVFGSCQLAADTIDREQRRVTVTFLSGQPIARVPLFEDPFFLEFEVTEKAADLSRLNAGASVLDTHRGGDLAAVLGKVERAWIENGKARATLRFSKRPEVDGVWQDVADGILGHVSMGVFLEQLEELKPNKGNTEDMRRFAVRRWQPYEISVVGIPADAGAHIETAADERRACRVTFSLGGEAMDDQNTTTEDDLDADEKPQTRAQLRAERDELKRRESIRLAAAHFSAGDVWAEKHIRLGTEIGDAMSDAAVEREKRTPKTRNDIGFGTDYDSGPQLHERLAAGLAAQIRGVEPSEAGRPFHGLGFTGVARELLRRQGRDGWLGKGREGDARAVSLSLSTSDYPYLLENVANKVLQPRYQAAQVTYRKLCGRRDLPDFHPTSLVRTGDFPSPLAVGEGGEIKLGYFSESRELAALGTYGRRMSITRKALINDSLGGFREVMNQYAQQLADFENAAFITLLTSASGAGPTMNDTGAFFNATAVTTQGGHANLTASGTAISDVNINIGAAMMARQVGGGSTGLGDGIKLNTQARSVVSDTFDADRA